MGGRFFFCKPEHVIISMEEMLAHVRSLSRQCTAIRVNRRAGTRQTVLKHRLRQMNLPLLSIMHRLQRNLVLCTMDEFEAHIRAVLRKFRCEMLALIRSLDNETRSEELLALLQSVTGSLTGV